MTNETFTPLSKAMHIMKKGYEIQKRSIIQNLDFYMQDRESNKDLFNIICVSCFGSY